MQPASPAMTISTPQSWDSLPSERIPSEPILGIQLWASKRHLWLRPRMACLALLSVCVCPFLKAINPPQWPFSNLSHQEIGPISANQLWSECLPRNLNRSLWYWTLCWCIYGRVCGSTAKHTPSIPSSAVCRLLARGPAMLLMNVRSKYGKEKALLTHNQIRDERTGYQSFASK